MRVSKPLGKQRPATNEASVFLAGSIEMGKAVDWQEYVTRELAHIKRLLVYNPRRDDWDSSWAQEIGNTQFRDQVNWELNHLALAQTIFMYFSPETQSPITLMEFGMYVWNSKLMVCCPEGFWRKGNVDIVCARRNITVYGDLESAVGALIMGIENW